MTTTSIRFMRFPPLENHFGAKLVIAKHEAGKEFVHVASSRVPQFRTVIETPCRQRGEHMPRSQRWTPLPLAGARARSYAPSVAVPG